MKFTNEEDKEFYLAQLEKQKKYRQTWQPLESRNYKKEYQLKKQKLFIKDHLPNLTALLKNVKGKDSIESFDEPIICSEFGCNRELTNTEKLCGKFCINHQTKNKIDVAMRISYPIKKSA